ncbi:MAG: hypothetical protein JRH20_13995 [Deltaproteobacteria bacterium]|nr:hypothetical protein [Deltaproteobacteria bacterium]
MSKLTNDGYGDVTFGDELRFTRDGSVFTREPIQQSFNCVSTTGKWTFLDSWLGKLIAPNVFELTISWTTQLDECDGCTGTDTATYHCK